MPDNMHRNGSTGATERFWDVFSERSACYLACWKEIHIGALKTMSIDTESFFSSPPDFSTHHCSSEISFPVILIVIVLVEDFFRKSKSKALMEIGIEIAWKRSMGM